MLLSQHPRVYDGRKVSAVERYVTEIDPQLALYKDSKVSAIMVPLEIHESRTPSVICRTSPQVLYLSKNLLTTLEGVQQFQSLRILSMADNLLEHFDELSPLEAIQGSLEALNLEGNPIARLPNYRAQVGTEAWDKGRTFSSQSFTQVEAW